MAEYKRHHDKRMAGDVFPEGSEFRDGVEKRYGSERYSDLAAPGMQEAHVGSSGTKRYSGAEVRAEVREGGMDADYYRQLHKEGAKFNGNAQDFLYDTFGLNFQGGGGKKPAKDPKPEAAPVVDDEGSNNIINNEENNQEIMIPGIPGAPDSIFSMEQNVNQDNDINTNIDGDNNTVTNDQDNSVGQYGGEVETEFLHDWMKDHDFFKDV